MARLTYSYIFTNVHKYDETGSYTGLQIASKLNQKNGQNYKLIDAIDIDWNGAWLQLTNSYIHNTEDLFISINQIPSLPDIEFIKNKLTELTEDVEYIVNTAITQSNLSEILNNYQKTIHAGEYIRISENNVISAYGLLGYDLATQIFANKVDLNDLVDNLKNNYYTKSETEEKASEISIQNISDIVIKGADERYNDLEKVSNWILSHTTYIDDNFLDFNNRLNRIDDALGYIIYDPKIGEYTYTDGVLKETHDLQIKTEAIENSIQEAIEQSYIAYNMSYSVVETIGVKSSKAEFVKLTQEEIDILNYEYANNLPFSIQVYSIKSDNQSEIPIIDTYNPNADLIYYKYINEVEATGLHKDIEDIEQIANNANEFAKTSLYRLYTSTQGTSYASLTLNPQYYNENDTSYTRRITLNVDEADINKDNGIIEKDGLITTFSLSNTLSYISTFEVIETNNNENNG